MGRIRESYKGGVVAVTRNIIVPTLQGDAKPNSEGEVEDCEYDNGAKAGVGVDGFLAKGNGDGGGIGDAGRIE